MEPSPIDTQSSTVQSGLLNSIVSNFTRAKSRSWELIGSACSTIRSKAKAVTNLLPPFPFYNPSNLPPPNASSGTDRQNFDEVLDDDLPIASTAAVVSKVAAPLVHTAKPPQKAGLQNRVVLGVIKNEIFKKNPQMTTWQRFKITIAFWLIGKFDVITNTAMAYLRQFAAQLIIPRNISDIPASVRSAMNWEIFSEDLKNVNCVVRAVASRLIRRATE